MQAYKILYCDFWKQVLVIILFPLLLVFPMVMVLISIKDLSDVLLFTIVFAWMAIMILALLYVLFRIVYVTTTLTITAKGLDLVTEKRNLLNRFEHMLIPFTNIQSITDDNDVNNNDRKFFTIYLKKPSKKIILMSPKTAPVEEMERLSLEIHDAIGTYNELQQLPAAEKIKEGSFYTSRFATFITYFFMVVLALITMAKLVDNSKVEWYRLLGAYSIGALWFSNYYAARRKAKSKVE